MTVILDSFSSPGEKMRGLRRAANPLASNPNARKGSSDTRYAISD